MENNPKQNYTDVRASVYVHVVCMDLLVADMRCVLFSFLFQCRYIVGRPMKDVDVREKTLT